LKACPQARQFLKHLEILDNSQEQGAATGWSLLAKAPNRRGQWGVGVSMLELEPESQELPREQKRAMLRRLMKAYGFHPHATLAAIRAEVECWNTIFMTKGLAGVFRWCGAGPTWRHWARLSTRAVVVSPGLLAEPAALRGEGCGYRLQRRNPPSTA
jgi:hypothetical protein